MSRPQLKRNVSDPVDWTRIADPTYLPRIAYRDWSFIWLGFFGLGNTRRQAIGDWIGIAVARLKHRYGG